LPHSPSAQRSIDQENTNKKRGRRMGDALSGEIINWFVYICSAANK
jgi:hypothetical protein